MAHPDHEIQQLEAEHAALEHQLKKASKYNWAWEDVSLIKRDKLRVKERIERLKKQRAHQPA